MSTNQVAPIIIKRKKIIQAGHHGGAWKVAYADFVTAMMAFFMLMWLLNATTETQRKGLADYFSPTIPVMRISGGGDGSFGGDNVATSDTTAQSGSVSDLTGGSPSGDEGLDQETFEEIEKSLTGAHGESMVSAQAQRHIVTRVTDDGLIVELFDLPNEPLFIGSSDQPTELMVELTGAVTAVFDLADNGVAVNGFTQSYPIVLNENPVWNISSSRADKTRNLVQTHGLPEDRIQRVTGHADRKPVAMNPMASRNNRIELILLRNKR